MIQEFQGRIQEFLKGCEFLMRAKNAIFFAPPLKSARTPLHPFLHTPFKIAHTPFCTPLCIPFSPFQIKRLKLLKIRCKQYDIFFFSSISLNLLA